MPNETLRVRLGRMDNTVLMQVLEMPDRFRDAFKFTASNGITVLSVCTPQLDYGEGKVHLRGSSNGADSRIVTVRPKGCAADYFSRLREALTETKAEMERIVRGEPEEMPKPQDAGFTFDESATI